MTRFFPDRRGRRDVYGESPHDDVRPARSSNRRHLSAPPVGDESYYLTDEQGYGPSGIDLILTDGKTDKQTGRRTGKRTVSQLDRVLVDRQTTRDRLNA